MGMSIHKETVWTMLCMNCTPHLLMHEKAHLTDGDYYVKRKTEQTIYAGIQEMARKPLKKNI